MTEDIFLMGYIQLKPHLYGCHIMKDKVDIPSSESQKGYGQGHHHCSIDDLKHHSNIFLLVYNFMKI